jgi:putative N6-adenine-specific DNA methylase
MCGTGTFALEAAMIASHIPAGWFRDFAFMGWPAFSPPQWEYLKKEAATTMCRPDSTLIFASDKNPRACQTLTRSLASAGLSKIVNVLCRDFFDVQPPAHSVGLVVLNPPYGRRLGSVRASDRLMRAISTKLITDYCGWQLALLVPHKSWLQSLPFPLRTHALVHGGLQLVLAVGTISVP